MSKNIKFLKRKYISEGGVQEIDLRFIFHLLWLIESAAHNYWEMVNREFNSY